MNTWCTDNLKIRPTVTFSISAVDEKVRTYAHIAYWGWLGYDCVFVPHLCARPVPR
jgi:hypothetical protein